MPYCCNCTGVTAQQVKDAVASGARTLPDVFEHCGKPYDPKEVGVSRCDLKCAPEIREQIKAAKVADRKIISVKLVAQ